MSRIFISENNSNQKNMSYLYNSLAPSTVDCKADAELIADDKRVAITYEVDSKYREILKSRLEEKIAEIIAISYKYSFFKGNIKTAGLSADEFEFLLASLIAADYQDDMRFIKNKLKRIEVYTIDGFYNFRLGALKTKWQEIVSYIPSFFSSGQLREFITYLINDNSGGKKVIIDGGNVYDKFYNKLNRSELIENDFSKGSMIIELILSGCGEVELRSKITEFEEKYIRDFYGGRVFFSKNYFS